MADLKQLTARAKAALETARSRWTAVDVGVRVFRRFSEDDGGSFAAALTYYTFFAVFPMLLFSASALGYITFGNAELRDRIIEKGIESIPLLRDALTPEGLEVIGNSRNSLALTGLVMALYAGSGGVAALEHALNRIYRVADEPNFIQKRLRSLRWLALIGAAVVVSVGLSTAGNVLPSIIADVPGVVTVLTFAIGIGVSLFIFLSMFKFLPAVSLTWKQVLPGAITATVAFEVLKIAGSAYLARGQATRNNTFGTFAASAALLVASYLISQVTLLAAEVNAVLAERRTTRQSSTGLEEGDE